MEWVGANKKRMREWEYNQRKMEGRINEGKKEVGKIK